MKLPTALLALAALAPVAEAGFHRRGQEVTIEASEGVEPAEAGDAPSVVTVTVPDYSDEQCVEWLQTVLASDADGSGGLSEEEFFDFLSNIEEPAHVADYFADFDSYQELGWPFKIVHKALACRCTDLGGEPGCCQGDAEIPFAGLTDESQEGMTPAQLKVATEYRADLCNSMAAVFSEVIPAPEMPESTTVATEPATTEAATTEAATTEATEPAATALVFKCEDSEACNTNSPSTDASSGWSSAGECGAGTEKACPDAYASDGQYAVGAEVSVDPADLPAVPLMEIDVVGSVIDYSTFDYTTLFDGDDTNDGDIPEYYDAAAVQSNANDNGILEEVITGFEQLTMEVASSMMEMDDVTSPGKRQLRGRRMQSSMGKLDPVTVTDISCPDGLIYAPKDAYCLNFKFKVLPDEGTPESIAAAVEAFEAQLVKAIDEDGRLYAIVKANKDDTEITGLGSPGGGFDYAAAAGDTDRSVDGSEEPAEEESSGLSTAAIVAIILCVICVPLAILAMYSRYRKVQDEKRRARLAEYSSHSAAKDIEAPAPVPEPTPEPEVAVEPDDDDESSAPSVWSDSKGGSEHPDGEAFVESESGAGVTAGSALAAMGAAGAAAAIAGTQKGKDNDKDAIIQEIRVLVKETNAPKSADELLAAYKGREEELLGHLRKMKTKQLEGDKSAVKAEVAELVSQTNPGKSAEELLASYEGREEELAKNLKKMKSKQDVAKVESLVASTKPGKSAEELLSAYAGREDELIKNLEKMQTKKTKEEVRSLVDEVNPGKSTKELLSAYEGREDELIKNLKKMKSKQTKDEVKSLVASTNPGKSAKDLLEAYEGREDELVKNLKKMQAKQEKEARPPSPTSAIKSEIAELVSQTNPGKSTEELLKAYEGREEELANHLRKLKSSKRDGA